MADIQITVHGQPAPQGSKKFVGHNRAGRGVLIESSKKVKPWRSAVVAAAVPLRPAAPLDGPLVADMVFTMPRPRSHYGTGRNAGQLKERYVSAVPDRTPDLSKLVRSTEDALTDAGVWADDARVVAYGRLIKLYAGDSDPDALDVPGAVIRVRAYVPAGVLIGEEAA